MQFSRSGQQLDFLTLLQTILAQLERPNGIIYHKMRWFFKLLRFRKMKLNVERLSHSWMCKLIDRGGGLVFELDSQKATSTLRSEVKWLENLSQPLFSFTRPQRAASRREKRAKTTAILKWPHCCDFGPQHFSFYKRYLLSTGATEGGLCNRARPCNLCRLHPKQMLSHASQMLDAA